MSIPEFVSGSILVLLFAGSVWQIFPAGGYTPIREGFWPWLSRLILPSVTLMLVLFAYVVRMTRAGVIDELKKPYVRTAVLKGMPQRQVIFKHVLRNALLPTITVIAISVGWLISGLIVIENVFNYPGLGRLMTFAIDRRDLPLLQAITLVTILVFSLSNLVADLLYAYLNPRIRLE